MSRTWTPNQLAAIRLRDRDVCVAAGAGSGKTGVLVERFISIVQDSLSETLPEPLRAGVSEILVITFTEKATKEMKGRIVAELDQRGLLEARREVETAYISTIHGFCSRLLKENPFEAGVDPEFVPLDPAEAKRLLRITFEDVVERAYADHDEEITELVASVQDERLFGADMRDPLATLAGAVEVILDRMRAAGHRLDDLDALRQSGPEAVRAAVLAPVCAHLNLAIRDIRSCCSRLHRIGTEIIGGLAGVRRDVLQHALTLHKLPPEAPWADVAAAAATSAAIAKRVATGTRRGGNSTLEMDVLAELSRIRAAAEGAAIYADIAAEREEAAERIARRFFALLEATWRAYSTAKRRQGVLDNEDLQAEAVQLLATSPGVLRRYRRRFRYLMVDEFQDTNPLQMRLLELLHPTDEGAPPNNLFVVGDVQQSIYGFRNADPTIFQGIARRFREENAGEFISLAVNYRSRPEILALANYVFGQIWRGEEMTFTPLEAGAQHAPKPAPSVELMLAGDMWRAAYLETEADAIAAYVQRIVARGELTITDRRHPRFGQPVRYQDVAVLLRGLPDIEKYERAFVRRQVPYFVVGGGRGYYARHEVRDVMNVLTALDRPLDDVALAAVLRSPMAEVDLETIYALAEYARAQAGGEHAPLYPAIEGFLESGGAPPEELERLRAFYETLEYVRSQEERHPVAWLLEKLLARTNYDARVLMRPGGRRRLANVRKLVQMANAAASHGVTEFIQRLREIERVSEQEGDAPTEEEASDVVRVMTIHKAKGLEFPVVILADMGRSLVFPERGVFLCDPTTLSVGCRLGDYKTSAYRAIEEARRERERRETARVLYVALTRAREHLVLCGSLQARKRQANWADQVFPYLGLLGVPDEPVVREAPGGVRMRVWPMAALLADEGAGPDQK